MPSMISMVVVLPAPFGPSRPKQMPSGTANDTPSTAVTRRILLDQIADFEKRVRSRTARDRYR